MTGNQIIAAYRATNELAGLPLPYRAARSLALLRKKLGEEAEIFMELEEAAVKKHGGVRKGGGSYRFPTPGAAQACAVELEELREDDVEIELPAVDLSDFADVINISPAGLEALEGIVCFEKEVDDG